MAGKITKIVLDADVINHFVRGNRLSLLPKIFPDYQFIVLDVVKKELPLLILSSFDKLISQGEDLCEVVFATSPAEMQEYFRMTTTD